MLNRFSGLDYIKFDVILYLKIFCSLRKQKGLCSIIHAKNQSGRSQLA